VITAAARKELPDPHQEPAGGKAWWREGRKSERKGKGKYGRRELRIRRRLNLLRIDGTILPLQRVTAACVEMGVASSFDVPVGGCH
jgi:hypothetical protein